MAFVGIVLAATLLVVTSLNIAGLENQPRIYTKDGSVHIRSGDGGDIVFEPQLGGKVVVGAYELNISSSVGPKGDRGEKGNDGVNGSRGTTGDKGNTGSPGVKGDRGDTGPTGLQGHNGTRGPPGQKGDNGSPGAEGLPGSPGAKGLPGFGFNGTRGPPGVKGTNGTQGAPGPKGPKGDIGEKLYHIEDDSQKIQCNTSNYGILRYFSTQLQLCTPKGWRYLAFHDSEVPLCSFDNVPETNIKAFYAASPGIMFQFNNNILPLINPSNRFNITAEILPSNSTLTYEDAIMRRAVHFSGNAYLNVSGISDDFWVTRNWSVMALMKFGTVKHSGRQEIGVLGHGTASKNQGLHLGVSNKQFIHGYYNNDFTYGKLSPYKWYHVTWTSEKLPQGNENRCIFINGERHSCDTRTKQYQGSGDTTIGTWWHRTHDNNLVLDHLIIASGIVQYSKSTDDKQLCYAKVVERNLP